MIRECRVIVHAEKSRPLNHLGVANGLKNRYLLLDGQTAPTVRFGSDRILFGTVTSASHEEPTHDGTSGRWGQPF